MSRTLDRLRERRRQRLVREAALSVTSSINGRDSIEGLRRRAEARVHPDRRELERILRLAFVPLMLPEESDEFSRTQCLARAYESGFRLFVEQSSAVSAYLTEGGMFGPIGVGWGKTGVSLMIAEEAARKGLRKILLHIEPSCLPQLVQNDIPYWRRRIPLSVPFIIIGGRSPKARRSYYKSERRGCYIVPYSLLSVRDTLEMLEWIDPDLVIADECHNLRDRGTARVKRWLHMMHERERELVAMSGTITSKTIEDYRFLINLALKEHSPLPQSPQMALAWSRVLDAGAVVNHECQTGPLEPLVDWANLRLAEDPTNKTILRPTVSDMREAFTLRLHSAPGVSASPDSAIKASISFENKALDGRPWYEHGEFWKKYDGWDRLAFLMDQVQRDYVTPDGDEINHAIHIFKWMVELGSGFYNELVWPTVEMVVKKHAVTETVAREVLAHFKDAHGLHQHYNKLSRRFFEHSPAGIDTPMEVARQINQHPDRLPEELVAAYVEWNEEVAAGVERFGFQIERYSRAVRVCSFKIDLAYQWAAHMFERHGSALVWVSNREMGRWAVEYFTAKGLPTLACPAGANTQIKAQFDPDTGKPDRVVVASIKAHGTGKNLQQVPAQLFLQWPREAKKSEQVLGRVHRNRVEEFRDNVVVNTLHLLPYDHVLLGACLVDTVYQHQTGSRRKLVYGNWDPMPKIFSPEFLKARGAPTFMLNQRQRSMLEEKFGNNWESQL